MRKVIQILLLSVLPIAAFAEEKNENDSDRVLVLEVMNADESLVTQIWGLPRLEGSFDLANIGNPFADPKKKKEKNKPDWDPSRIYCSVKRKDDSAFLFWVVLDELNDVVSDCRQARITWLDRHRVCFEGTREQIIEIDIKKRSVVTSYTPKYYEFFREHSKKEAETN